MYKNLELLNRSTHLKYAIKQISDFKHAKETISFPVTISEFFESCKHYPILFLCSNNQWSACALTGYQEGQNVFIDNKNNWNYKLYIPFFARVYPFIFANESQEDTTQFSLAIDSSQKYEYSFSDDPRRLFDDYGNNSPFLDDALLLMTKFQQEALQTESFINLLNSFKLLDEYILRVSNSLGVFELKGFYALNEQRIKSLDKKKLSELCKRNLFPLITAHLISLLNVKNLGLE